MRGNPVIYLLAVALAAASFGASAEGCDTNAKKRIVTGQQPTANTLYAHIQHVDMGAWDTDFDEETFTYIGDAHAKSGKTYKVGYLETSWGLACHATNRLFIFDDSDNYLGQYAGIDVNPRDIKIRGAVLFFPFEPSTGNTLDLENGPPDRAWLDGDNPEWTPTEPKAAPPAPHPGKAPPNPGAAPPPPAAF